MTSLADGIKAGVTPGRRSQMPGQKQQSRRGGTPEVFLPVGLPVNKPPAFGGLPFDESSDHLNLDRKIERAFFMPKYVAQQIDRCKAARCSGVRLIDFVQGPPDFLCWPAPCARTAQPTITTAQPPCPDDDSRGQGGATDEFGGHADEVVPGSLVFADPRPGRGAQAVALPSLRLRFRQLQASSERGKHQQSVRHAICSKTNK